MLFVLGKLEEFGLLIFLYPVRTLRKAKKVKLLKKSRLFEKQLTFVVS